MENLQLTALLPDEMMVAQNHLILWCEQKILSVKNEVIELSVAIKHAKASRWSAKVLTSQHGRAQKRLLFFEKMKAALEAGYYIVPNFPVDLFAIRTKNNPAKKYTVSYWGSKDQDAQQLPIGEGEYRNPFPVVHRSAKTDDESAYSYAEGWDELEFPVTMLKPEIIAATNKAMALQIFDQFGVLPASQKEDPIIVGQIKRKIGTRVTLLSFMIAWHFNTNIL